VVNGLIIFLGEGADCAFALRHPEKKKENLSNARPHLPQRENEGAVAPASAQPAPKTKKGMSNEAGSTTQIEKKNALSFLLGGGKA